ncbi:extracellular matrix regulator RemB [Aliibacillus thermotolerans]|uniref:Extracellular matrix regulator RemB n=1 Tax=Aliibacillus thermotolerans TaxID=1834418 RepID=A0ABW0U7V7_9BACI|nr:extracellular matrix/biofilm biosynthesis regulator RemA family protein [Aliibacillus thermotolerans]MDA3129307.1 DUF370 domain-containing protein [Aliibacillus thermotolerans]
MFIHLGGDEVILSKDVVAILNYDSNDETTTEQLLSSYNQKNVVEIGEDVTKSVVVTVDKIYLSPISSLTLKRRAQAVEGFDDYSEDALEEDDVDMDS